jgi:sec-independent protein translocase protein TatA
MQRLSSAIIGSLHKVRFLLHFFADHLIFSTFGPQTQQMTTTLILGILGGLGAPEIIIILIIVLLMFGGKKIPELMKGLGRGIKDFKDASKGEPGSSEAEKK